jgi:hypothetical protein
LFLGRDQPTLLGLIEDAVPPGRLVFSNQRIGEHYLHRIADLKFVYILKTAFLHSINLLLVKYHRFSIALFALKFQP